MPEILSYAKRYLVGMLLNIITRGQLTAALARKLRSQ